MESRPQSYETRRRVLANECVRLSNEAHHRYCRALHEPLYLIGSKRPPRTATPGTATAAEVWDRFSVATEAEHARHSELFLVHGEPLPRHLTREQTTDYIATILRREPLAIFGDD
jgi:hypothetical protein